MTVPLHYTQHGDPAAPTVLLLGSLGSDSTMWVPQIPALVEKWHVLAVDHRGHGHSSPPPDGPYAMADLASDVIALLDSLGLDAVHYIGLSLGGAIGQWIAAHHPERIRSLALLCTAPAFPPSGPWLDRAAAVRTEGVASIAEAVVSRWFSPEFAERHPEVLARYVRMVEATTDEGYAACCEALANWDGRADAAHIVAPTLVIAGAQDPATPPSTMQALADTVAGSEFVVVDPGAHLANVEQPDLVTTLLVEHISRAQDRAAAQDTPHMQSPARGATRKGTVS
ncbi:3-oxoadipate enol-lactonase [Rhodococcus coprophilus]